MTPTSPTPTSLDSMPRDSGLAYAIDASFVLARRGVRDLVRVPVAFFPSIMIPLFFYLIYSAGIGPIASRIDSPGLANYHGFVIATILFLSVTNSASAAGFAVVRDIESGYFDKLLLTPVSRPVLILGRLLADGIRAALASGIILLVGVFTGAGLASGVGGFLAIMLMTTGWSMAWAGIALTIALRTGSLDATQLAFFIGFPIVFLSPAFGPRELLGGWMQRFASVNPVSYLIESTRGIILTGFNAGDFALALLAVAGVGTITLSSAMHALRRRTRAAS